MGQIQNAISGALGNVAVGAIAEQKTKMTKKELETLAEEKAKLIGEKTELVGKNTELKENLKGTYEEAKIAIGEAYEELNNVQARHSEAKSQLAKANAEREIQSRKNQREGYREWVSTVSEKRGKR